MDDADIAVQGETSPAIGRGMVDRLSPKASAKFYHTNRWARCALLAASARPLNRSPWKIISAVIWLKSATVDGDI